MEKEYYFLNLNHNNSKNPCKLDNIIYKGKNYHYPFEVEDDVLEDVYDGKVGDLSYNKATPASRKDIIRITKIYKEMSDEDLVRYSDTIKRIKDTSKYLYERQLQMEREELSEEKAARDFLLHYFV